MAQRRELDESLLTEVTRRLAEISETQHELARWQRILSRAATQLRTGKGGQSVLAEIREQSPELLRDYCDLHITLTTQPPLRPVPRIVASGWSVPRRRADQADGASVSAHSGRMTNDAHDRDR